MPADDFLKEKTRAEDILLGALGYGEEASILSLEATVRGYRGTGCWRDGEKFQFEFDEEMDDLQSWALAVFTRLSQVKSLERKN